MPTEPFPEIAADSVGWITRAQMVEVDRVMVEDLQIGLIQMMENAGRNLARVVIERFGPDRVSVLTGSGGNGGGGLVAARHLANAGIDVIGRSTRPADELAGVPARQFMILERMGIAVTEQPVDADLTIDALIGYSLRGEPRGRTAELISGVSTTRPVVSLDTPSGLDVDTAATPGAVVSADVTMTLALPKIGLRDAPQVGELLLADISVPPSVTSALGPGAPDFRGSPIVRLV